MVTTTGHHRRASVITSRPSSLTLIDGASVLIRQLEPDDYDAVVALSDTLSDTERYMRFFTTHPGYLDQWARTLTTRSDEQCALGVFEDDALIGTASYVLTVEPGCAEVSVVIAHLQHARGVGTALLRTLGRIAADDGIHHLVADVLAENSSMRRVITDGGWPCTQRLDGSVLSIRVDLDAIHDEGAD